MLLPVGELGVSQLPEQEAVLAFLRDHVTEHRFYVFPWSEDPAELERAYATQPHGVLALTPPGEPFSFGRLLAGEAVSNLLGGLLAAVLFAAAAPRLGGWGRRIGFGAALGAFATLAIDVSYWNWYGFPTVYLAAQFVDSVVGWSLAALVLGWWLGRAPAAGAPSA